ncbi:MAG: LytTR family DNA-binding domain-containing protein [Flavobacteriales bacterium]|jgi:DNA-binding LytR/AlgR family response regulator|nr:LytTR family DNA-binding domain-containing protein [Flavobacteriales bacterium]MDG1440270.1 LytTR family DNA-binding domain-containing protein [Flavobacteriales bacterium]
MIRVIIVDDDELCISVIEDMISQLDDFICIETFQNALDAYNYLEANDVDVVFLDVEMPKMGGIELLKSLKKSPMVVMITSHEEFALESYEYNVTDFLKKPAEWSRFLKTIEKIRKEFLDLAAQLLESSDQEHVFIKTDSKLVQLNLSQVLWVEALGNYIRVHTEEDKYTVLSTMKEIEAKLPPKDFIRVQRSFIIRVDKVKAIEDNYIIIKDKEIHIGKSYKEDFNKRINYL